MPPRALAKWRREAYLPKEPIGGRTGFDGDVETGAAGRGAAGLVKSGNKSNCQQRLRLRLRCLGSEATDRIAGRAARDHA